MTTIRGPGFTVTITTEQIELTSLGPEPDPGWRFTDAAGHEHYRGERGWPTLGWVIDERYWCPDCEDEHEDGHWACSICGEWISPGMRPASARRFIMGPTSGEAKLDDGRVYFLTAADVARLRTLVADEWAALFAALPPEQLVAWEQTWRS